MRWCKESCSERCSHQSPSPLSSASVPTCGHTLSSWKLMFFGNISLKQTTHLSGSERQEWAAAISFILDSIFSCDCEEGAWVQIWINNYLLLWSSHCMLVRVELLCLQSHLVIYAVMRVSHQLPWPCKPSWSTQWELSCQPQEPDNLEKVTVLDLGFALKPMIENGFHCFLSIFNLVMTQLPLTGQIFFPARLLQLSKSLEKEVTLLIAYSGCGCHYNCNYNK